MLLRTSLLLCLSLQLCTLFAQINTDISQTPSFVMYGENYFITGASLKEKVSKTSSDVKFRIGFAHRLLDEPMFWGLYPFLTYQQKSFWNLYQESAPFRESNYNPGIAFGKAIKRNGVTKGVAFFEFEHESNGRDSLASRSWNKLSFNSKWSLTQKFQLDVDVWIPVHIDKENNEDLSDYIGYQRIGGVYYLSPRWIAEASTHLAFTDGLRGNASLGLSYKYTKMRDRYLYLQFFNGYTEDLHDYNVAKSMLRIGISFRQDFFNPFH